MKYVFTLIATLGFALASCEETVDVGELPYEELIVVNGIIQVGLDIDIGISKTLPPLTSGESWQQTEREKYYITDATGYVVSNQDTFTLRHVGFDRYIAYKRNGETAKVESGKNYSLHVFWKGKHCWSSTSVPRTTQPALSNKKIDSAKFYSFGQYLKFALNVRDIVRRNETVVYSANIYNDNYLVPTIVGYEFNEVSNEENLWRFAQPYYRTTNAESEEVKVKVSGYENQWSELPMKEKIDAYNVRELIIERYDIPFYKFHKTVDRYSDGDGFFGGSGTNPVWNVEGDGIGIFIGKNVQTISFDWD